MFCTRCGAKMQEGAKFCTACGGAARTSTSAPQIDLNTQAKEAAAVQPPQVVHTPVAPATPVAQASPVVQAAAQAQVACTAAAQVSAAAAQASAANFDEVVVESKRKSRRRIPPVLLIILVVLAMATTAYAAHTAYRYYVENIKSPITTVEKFTAGWADYDMATCIKCMDPNIQKVYESTFGAIDSALNMLGVESDSQSTFESYMYNFLPELSDYTDLEISYSIELVDEAQEINENNATVTGIWIVTGIVGDEVFTTECSVCFHLKLELGKWYIQYDDDFIELLGDSIV